MSETEQTGFLDRLPWYTVPAILLGVPLLMAILSGMSPAFYESVVWQYYWGPIKADAVGASDAVGLCSDGSFGPCDGVAAFPGYNVVNTASWAILMGLCLVGITQIVTALKVRMNNTLVVGATGWVVAGAIWHVIEDTGLMARPLQYFYITPPIYLLFGLGGILSIVLGSYLHAVAERTDLERAMQKLWYALSAAILVYTLAWAAEWEQVVRYVNPVHVAVAAMLTYFAIRARVMTTRFIDPREVMLIMALFPLLLSFDYVYSFVQDPWSGRSAGYPSAVYIAPLLSAAVTLVIFAIARARFAKKQGAVAAAFMAPVNLLIVFSQMMDAFATSLGLDLTGYVEKHVLSGWVINSFRDLALAQGWEFAAEHPTFFAFTPLKLAVSLAVVYAIDIYSKDDVKKYPTLIGFVKFGIIMVGIGPGVRNAVRLTLGV